MDEIIIPDDISHYEVAQQAAQISRREALLVERNGLLAYLALTDWCAAKCTDTGIPMSDAYPEEYAARQRARKRINEIDLSLQNPL